MKTAIRMDDITPDMDWNKFNRVRTILEEANIRPLIGVVPFGKDETLHFEEPHEDFAETISELVNNGWIVALHGYNHLYTSKSGGIFPINNFSEFAGVSFSKQNEMIREGLKKLAEWNIKTEIFMAPGHTFDKNTLRALKDNEITSVTDGFGNRPYTRDGIKFYPISKKRSECVGDSDGYSTYVLHTNTMSDEGIEEFKRLINDNRSHFIDYSEYTDVPAVKRGTAGIITEYLLAMAKHILVSRRASKGTVIHKQ